MTRPPTALTIAGSDSGGGAGIQADLKTFLDHGVFGMAAITAITAQNTCAVTAVLAVEVSVLVAQIEAVFADLPVGAVKIGMLGSRDHVCAVADALTGCTAPIILDPVMVSSSGHRLLDPGAEQAIRERLLPLATLVTPNLPETAVLSKSGDQDAQLEWAARQSTAILVTGGDGEGQMVHDALFLPGRPMRRWSHLKVGTRPFHGTGCTLSSAIAARMARGHGLEEAVALGIGYVQKLVHFGADQAALGAGNPPLLHGLWRTES